MSERISRRQLLIHGAASVAATSNAVQMLMGQAGPTCAELMDGFHFDQLGLIVQSNCDGGDTAQREGMYWFGTWMWQNNLGLGRFGGTRQLNFERVLNYLEDGKTGRFRRHPTQTQNGYNLPEKTSRDQLIPLIAAMGVYRDFQRLDRLRDRIHQKFYFVNSDWLLFFDEYLKRALDRDLQFGGETDKVILDKAVDFRLGELRRKQDMDDVGDDLNLIMQLALAAVRRGEKIAAIRARYSRDRPKNWGVYLTRYRAEFRDNLNANKDTMIDRIRTGINRHGWKPDCTGVLGAMKWYFREEEGGNPGIVTLYKPILARYFAASVPA